MLFGLSILIILLRNEKNFVTLLGCTPLGYLIAMILFKALFTRQDAHFDRAEEASTKLIIYYGIQSVAVFALLLYRRLRVPEEKLGNEASSCEILTKANKTKRKIFLIVLSFALMFSAYYLHLIKWPHITNQFSYTHVRSLHKMISLTQSSCQFASTVGVYSPWSRIRTPNKRSPNLSYSSHQLDQLLVIDH